MTADRPLDALREKPRRPRPTVCQRSASRHGLAAGGGPAAAGAEPGRPASARPLRASPSARPTRARRGARAAGSPRRRCRPRARGDRCRPRACARAGAANVIEHADTPSRDAQHVGHRQCVAYNQDRRLRTLEHTVVAADQSGCEGEPTRRRPAAHLQSRAPTTTRGTRRAARLRSGRRAGRSPRARRRSGRRGPSSASSPVRRVRSSSVRRDVDDSPLSSRPSARACSRPTGVSATAIAGSLETADPTENSPRHGERGSPSPRRGRLLGAP